MEQGSAVAVIQLLKTFLAELKASHFFHKIWSDDTVMSYFP
jgi:hypothetical protein